MSSVVPAKLATSTAISATAAGRGTPSAATKFPAPSTNAPTFDPEAVGRSAQEA